MNSKRLRKYGSFIFLAIVFIFMAVFRHDVELTENEERMTENYFEQHVGTDQISEDDLATNPEEDTGTES
ncbi:hypothetical protein CR205_16895 [Alteribacter lacisalsi]|uniref:Uncharacterized protein n=1 Tax=Alteribacter lacisalsi TaxID=2045244 RepID=A0A2W0HGY1_9BACI|nr:hypothetical protein [Alteribacter lacisalsi]PYZ96049.1 hypothetical protein CR205_16895 [Alteribacter lacisalsi]